MQGNHCKYSSLAKAALRVCQAKPGRPLSEAEVAEAAGIGMRKVEKDKREVKEQRPGPNLQRLEAER